MTGLPPPPGKKPRKKRAKRKAKKKGPTAKEVQDEQVTAEEVIEEATTIYHDKPSAPEPLPTVAVQKKMTNNVFACIWKGEGLPAFCNNVYNAKYVECLMNGVKRHIPNGRLTMLCDEYYYPRLSANKRLRAVRFEKFYSEGIGGWTRIFEILRENLRPKMGKRRVWMGLDTVLTGNCEWLFKWNKSPVGLPMDPLRPTKACNAVWTFNHEGAAFVADAYEVAKLDNMEDYLLFGQPSEMQLLRYLFQEEKWAPLEERPKRLLSYRKHVEGLVNPLLLRPSLIYFHGTPKPHQLALNDPTRMMWGG